MFYITCLTLFVQIILNKVKDDEYHSGIGYGSPKGGYCDKYTTSCESVAVLVKHQCSTSRASRGGLLTLFVQIILNKVKDAEHNSGIGNGFPKGGIATSTQAVVNQSQLNTNVPHYFKQSQRRFVPFWNWLKLRQVHH